MLIFMLRKLLEFYFIKNYVNFNNINKLLSFENFIKKYIISIDMREEFIKFILHDVKFS